jgi:hypothetical protein
VRPVGGFSGRVARRRDMPLRGMSSHTAARCFRVICGWGFTASSTHENKSPATSNFAQGVDMPRQAAKPAAACSLTQLHSISRLPSRWPSARHACLALATPIAYRRIIPCSRGAWCSAGASGRPPPCYSSQSPFVGKSVGVPTDARIAGKRPVPARSGTRVAVFPSVRGEARRDARERPPTAPSAWFPRATQPDPQLINAAQSRTPKGFLGYMCLTRCWVCDRANSVGFAPVVQGVMSCRVYARRR